MKKIKARVNIGHSNIYKTREIELYTAEEAKSVLNSRTWEVGEDIYSPTERNKRVGWFAQFTDMNDRIDGIYIEAK